MPGRSYLLKNERGGGLPSFDLIRIRGAQTRDGDRFSRNATRFTQPCSGRLLRRGSADAGPLITTEPDDA